MNTSHAKAFTLGLIRGAFNKFPDFFVQAFKIVVDSWKFIMLLLYILWDDWPIFMISGSNQQLQQKLEYTLLKPNCHSWWISKMHSVREDTLEERYVIKFCFKFGKMPHKRMECFRPLLGLLAWIEHQFLSGIRDSRKAGSLWGMMRGVGGIRMSIHQSWLAVVMRQSRRWKKLWRRSLTHSHKRTFMGPSRSTTSALQPEEITLKGTRVSCVLSIKVPIRKTSGNLFNDRRTLVKRMNPFLHCSYALNNTTAVLQ